MFQINVRANSLHGDFEASANWTTKEGDESNTITYARTPAKAVKKLLEKVGKKNIKRHISETNNTLEPKGIVTGRS